MALTNMDICIQINEHVRNLQIQILYCQSAIYIILYSFQEQRVHLTMEPFPLQYKVDDATDWKDAQQLLALFHLSHRC